MKQTFFLYGMIILMIACSPKNPATTIDYFGEATKLKAETEVIQESFKEAIQNLRNERNSMMVQGRTLTDEELIFIEKVNEIITDNGEFNRFVEEIDKAENAYDPNGQELLYLNQLANNLVKKIQTKINTLVQKEGEG